MIGCFVKKLKKGDLFEFSVQLRRKHPPWMAVISPMWMPMKKMYFYLSVVCINSITFPMFDLLNDSLRLLHSAYEVTWLDGA